MSLSFGRAATAVPRVFVGLLVLGAIGTDSSSRTTKTRTVAARITVRRSRGYGDQA